MTNPTIQTDLADILKRLDNRLERIEERLTKLEVGQTEIKGHITTLDEKLSGKIDVLDQKIVGQKDIAAKTSDQLEKRIANQEFSNRIVLGGLAVTILGGIASYFGWIGKP